MELQHQILTLVDHLNNRCYELTEGAVTFLPFTFTSNGESWSINFLEEALVDDQTLESGASIEQLIDAVKNALAPILESLNKINLEIFN